jgi:hypothetical protein
MRRRRTTAPAPPLYFPWTVTTGDGDAIPPTDPGPTDYNSLAEALAAVQDFYDHNTFGAATITHTPA